MKNEIIYEFKIQLYSNNSLKIKTIGDLQELKINLEQLNISRRRNMKTEVTNAFKPLQQTIYTKEVKETKKLSKDEIIHDLRAEIVELRAENAQLRAENAQLKAENDQLKAENIELRALVKQLMIKVEELTIRVEELTAENLQLRAKIAELENR